MFRADAAQPYDDRCLSWRYDAHRLSEPALRALAEPLGVTGPRIDPVLSAPPDGVGAPAPVAPPRALA